MINPVRLLVLFMLLPLLTYAQHPKNWSSVMLENDAKASALGYDSMQVDFTYVRTGLPAWVDVSELPHDTTMTYHLPVEAIPAAVTMNTNIPCVVIKDDKGRILIEGDTSRFGRCSKYTYRNDGKLASYTHCGEKGCVTWTILYDAKGRIISASTPTRPDMLMDFVTYSYARDTLISEIKVYYEHKLQEHYEFTYSADGLLKSCSSYDENSLQQGGSGGEVFRYYRRKRK